MMRCNIVYSDLRPEDHYTDYLGSHEFIHSRLPVPGCQVYAYLNLNSVPSWPLQRQEGEAHVLIIEEPEVVLPQQYDPAVWTWFDHVFSAHSYLCQVRPGHIDYFYTWRGATPNPGPYRLILTDKPEEREEKYPLEGRVNGIVMIAGNKSSPAPSQIYSMRGEAAEWWWLNGETPFDAYGTPPWVSGMMVDAGTEPRLNKFAQYRYAFVTENTAHPQYSLGYHQKMPDPLEARTIPIYYGCQDIEKYVPKECFIDYRDFGSYAAVDKYIQSITEDRYRQYIDAIDAFVCGGGLRPWSWQDLYRKIVTYRFGPTDTDIVTDGEKRVIETYIKPGDIVFDVGARVGEWSRHVPKGVELYAFEPDPEARLEWEQPVSPYALSDRVGTVEFYNTSLSLYNLCLKPEMETTQAVETITVDCAAEALEIDHIDFLKLDIEGGEWAAIKGAEGLIKAGKIKHIQFEYGPCYPAAKATLTEVFRFLKTDGYDVYKIHPDRIERVYTPVEDYRYANFLAIRKEIVNMKDTVCVVFSKDRPMQLDACLRSLKRHCTDWESMDVKVLWTGYPPYTVNGLEAVDERPYTELVHETDFQSDLLSMVDGYKYVMFVTDDTIFVRDFDMGTQVIYCLEKGVDHPGDAIGFSLRLGDHTNYCYMLDKKQYASEGCCHRWAHMEGDHGYPLELSSSVYLLDDLLPLLESPTYNNPNTLEAFLDWSKDQFKVSKPYLMRYSLAVAFSNPVNKVQTVFTGNRSGNNPLYSINRLTNLFSQGYSINVEKFDDFIPTGVHQEVPYEFVDGAGRILAEKPEVSILILNYNGGDNIKKCLASIDRTLPGRDYEVIVWDNASTDGSREWLRSREQFDTEKKLTVVESAINIGIQAREKLFGLAHGEYTVICDNDVILTPGWLGDCIQWARIIPDAGIIAPMTNYASGPQSTGRGTPYIDDWALDAFAAAWSAEPGHKGNFLQIWRVVGFFMFITPACLERVGNMRTFGLFGFDDDDYSIRASLAGLKVLINQGLYIHHTGGPQGRGDTQYALWMQEAWEMFKRAWGLPESFQYGKEDYVAWIMSHTVFNKDLHFIPIKEQNHDEQEGQERQDGDGKQEQLRLCEGSENRAYAEDRER